VTRRGRTVEAVVVTGIVAAVMLAATIVIFGDVPLGWDEAVYASRSRSLVTDIAASHWQVYRPPGLPALGLLGGTLGFADQSLRAVTLVLGVATLVTIWWLARALWGPVAAILALVTVIGTPVFVAELTVFHTDLPSAGLALLLMALLWHEFEQRPEPGALVMAAAPIAAAAFYVRYGTIVAIGGIAIAAVVLWHRKLLRHWRLTGTTLALAGALLLPHGIEAAIVMGSPFGLLLVAGEVANTTGPLAAAVRYLLWLPIQLAGPIAFVVMLIGVVFAAMTARDAIRRRGPISDARRLIWLYLPAGVTATGMLLISHAERRYMVLPVVLAVIAGAGAIRELVGRLRREAPDRRRSRIADPALVALILVVAAAAVVVGVRRMVVQQRTAELGRWQIEVGVAIRANAGGRCALATTVPPIIGWYSACEAAQFSAVTATRLRTGPRADPTYVVFTEIDAQRSSATDIERYRELVRATAATRLDVVGVGPGIEVFRLPS
jgi:4-amino-4-deoxy-L-arabinose transferase-like glycosyltransferase